MFFRMLLWHGSRLTNWAGILGQGLRIAPPEAPVTGYMVRMCDCCCNLSLSCLCECVCVFVCVCVCVCMFAYLYACVCVFVCLICL